MSDPIRNPGAGMSRLQRAQMDWALKGQERADQVRGKYKLEPSKLGGKLHRARQERLENASVRSRAKMIGRSAKFEAKRGLRKGKQNVKQAVSEAPGRWARFKRNVGDKIAAQRQRFRDFTRGDRGQKVEQGPLLAKNHPEARKLPLLKSLGKLDEMIGKESPEISAKFENGELTFSSSRVSFGAASRRVFGSEKSAETKTKNADSIKAALSYIEKQSSPEVRKLVENAYIQLPGDPKGSKLTVADRIDRGTYLSSEFVKQLKEAAEHAQKATVMMQNQRAVDHFLSNQPSEAIQTVPKQYSEIFKGPGGDPLDGFDDEVEQSGLSKWVDDTIEQGGLPSYPAKDFPETYRNLKTVVDQETRKPPDQVGADKNEPLLGRLKQQLKVMQHNGNEAKVNGKDSPISLTDSNLRGQAKTHFGNPKVFSQMVASANQNIVQSYTERGPELNKNLANAVRGWIDANPPDKTQGVTQEDLDWLADQIENKDYLDLPETSLVNKMFSTYDESRDMWNVTESMRQEIQSGADELDPLGKKEYEALKAKGASMKELNEFQKKLAERAQNLQELKPESFSKMLGPSIKSIIAERNRRLDVNNKGRAEFRQQAEKTLASNLGKFPDLDRAARSVKRGAYPALKPGQVDSAGQFFRGVLKQDLGDINHPQSLDALDEFAELQDQLDEIARKGGVEKADPKELEEIQKTARKLKDEAQRLGKLGQFVDSANDIEDLEFDEHDELVSSSKPKVQSQKESQSALQLKALGKALESAAETIDQEVEPYLNIATQVADRKADRRLAHLPDVHAQHNVQVNNLETDSLDKIDADVDPRTAQGKAPSRVVDNDLRHAFKTTGMTKWRNKSRMGANPMKTYDSFAKSSLPVLDRFAQFAVDHEDDTQLLRKSKSSDLSEPEQKRLEAFETGRQQMAKEVGQLETELEKLRSVFDSSVPPQDTEDAGSGLPDEVREHLERLDSTIQHMKSTLASGEFIGTQGDSPDPRLDGGALARPWSGTSRNLDNADSLAKALGGDTFMQSETESALENFKDFNEDLAAKMKKHPIALRSQSVVNDLGELDILAARARLGLEDVEKNIEQLRQLEQRVGDMDENELPSAFGKWDGDLEDMDLPPLPDQAKQKYLGSLRSARQDLEAQHALMSNRLRDFEIYRGDQFPNAGTSASIHGTWQSIKDWSRPKMLEDLELGLAATAGPIVDQAGGDESTKQVVDSAVRALDPGLSSLGRIMRAPDLTQDPILTGPYRPNDRQLQSLRQVQQGYADDLRSLESLADQSAKMLQEVQTLSGHRNQIDLEALEDVPGGREWHDFNQMMQEAVSAARQRKLALDNAIQNATRKPTPMAATPNAEALASRAAATKQRIAQGDGLAQRVAIDKNQLPQQPRRYNPGPVPQQDPRQAHGAINAFLGAKVADQAKLQAFQQAWQGGGQAPAPDAPAPNGGPPAELPWAYLDYLNTSGQSPHKVQFQAFDPNDDDSANEVLDNLQLKGDRVLVGTQDPPGYKTFYKDEAGDWRMFDPAKPLSQPKVDPHEYIQEIGQPLDNLDMDDDGSMQVRPPGNSQVTIVSIGE